MTKIILCCLFVLLAVAPTAAEPIKIRLQYASTSQFVALMPVVPKELYRHWGESYVVEPVFMRGSGPALTALAAGEIELAALAPPSIGNMVLTAKLTPNAIVQVLSSDVPGYAGSQLWCRDEIKAISDLKGRTIGINSRGSTPEVGVRVMLGRNGIKDSEWQAVEMPFAAAIPAIDSKRVDCAVMVSPWYLLMQKKPGYRALFSLGEVLGSQENVTWNGKPEWIAKNRAALVDFVEDHIRMRHWVQDPATHAEAIKLAAKLEKRPAEDIAHLWTTQDNFHHPDGMINMERLQKNLDDLVTFGLLPGKVDVAKVVDPTIQREALARIRPKTN
jgi:ABC-type nitrate/sulfonate/bicarbonate transport system substrate-binding protein